MLMIWLMLLFPHILKGQSGESQTDSRPVFGRKYKMGEVYRYQLTTSVNQNGKWVSTNISVCELKVVPDSNEVPYDEIRWLSAKELTAKDTIDHTKEALSVRPYRISLDPKGLLPIPKIEIPSMTGPITDFNTFFVAVGPQLGATKLKRKGDNLEKDEPVKGNFSNGKNILQGEDCLLVSVRMTGETTKNVLLRTSFLPPSHPCLTYITQDMQAPVVRDTMNNFQMIMPAGKGQYNLQYGREFFYINSSIRKSDGKIEEADMSNTLNLRIKLNCGADYKTCQMEVPFVIERTLKLELL